MFGTRFLAATAATLVGGSLLLAQQSPSQPQGETLPGQQPNTVAPAAPTAPAAPAAQPGTPPAQPQVNPAQPQGQALPGQQPNQVQPTQVQPNAGQPGQAQPRTQDNSQQNRENSQRSNDQSQQATAEEAKFVVKAGEINLAEINLGQLAAQRASRQDIRQFASQLVRDHSTNLQQLNQLANRHSWKGAERMDQEHQQLFQKLAAMQGQQFDQDFLKKMVEGHKKAAEIFKHASENCKNAELKQYATQTLAAIQQHEKEAQRLNGQNQNQGQTTQPTSSEKNDATQTDGQRTDQNQNRNNDVRGTDVHRNDTNRTSPNKDREEKKTPDR